MSQHIFEIIHNGESTLVLMGWDKPLQGYFMVIEKESDEDEPYWSNLLHAQPPHPKTLASFLAVLNQLKITIPQAMIEEVLEDGAANLGNKRVAHFVDNGIYKRNDLIV